MARLMRLAVPIAIAAGQGFQRDLCEVLLEAASARDDAELAMSCRSRLAPDQCDSLFQTLGDRPWQRDSIDVTCERHADLIQRRFLEDETLDSDLDSAAHTKTKTSTTITAVMVTSYVIPGAPTIAPPAAAEPTETSSPSPSPPSLSLPSSSPPSPPSPESTTFDLDAISDNLEGPKQSDAEQAAEDVNSMISGQQDSVMNSLGDDSTSAVSTAAAPVQAVNDMIDTQEAAGTQASVVDSNAGAAASEPATDMAASEPTTDTEEDESDSSAPAPAPAPETDSFDFDQFVNSEAKYDKADDVEKKHRQSSFSKSRLSAAVAMISALGGVSLLALRSTRWVDFGNGGSGNLDYEKVGQLVPCEGLSRELQFSRPMPDSSPITRQAKDVERGLLQGHVE
mmetsp:Transcript_106301/g.189022  ORF Transcript_106301/g.189022 Transcript_106301/m.189022 type:complete len:396 (+) Transcript_106301:92-1279(+)